MKIYKTEEILDDLENCIEEKKPFSLLRFGDGMLKAIYSILYNDTKSIKMICEKEGLPSGGELIKIFELWGYYARHANYIDTPEVYFNNEFWSRSKRGKKISNGTKNKLIKWRELYYTAEFDNENFCNPEVNFLMLLSSLKKTIIDLIRGKKICIITDYPQVGNKFKQGFKVSIVDIVKQYDNQYYSSFRRVVSIINKTTNDFDLWLVSAGELGRIYTGLIKENGGRAIDIGSVVKFWVDGEIPDRLSPFITKTRNPKIIRLTTRGEKYGDYI